MAEYLDARISAAERDRALLELSEHLGTGRLSLTEFEQRSAAAVAATTSNELAALFADLPGAAHPAGDERTALPWPASLVAASLVVTPPLAYFLHKRALAVADPCDRRNLGIRQTRSLNTRHHHDRADPVRLIDKPVAVQRPRRAHRSARSRLLPILGTRPTVESP